MEASQSATGFPVHPNIFYGYHTGAPVFPPLSPGWICECSTLPFEERLPLVCSTPPFMVPPWVTSSCAVLSSAVHPTSGESKRIFTAALMVAVCMPFAISTPISCSYSITTPSGNDQCSASAEADGAGLSSEKIPGSTKPGSSSPPWHRMRT